MNAISQIDLKETARMLGKCPRQVMRYVEAGMLKASGGGRRRQPYAFVKADVEAFNRLWSGVSDVDLLARIVHAFVMKRKNPVAYSHWLNQGFLMLWRWHKTGRKDLIQDCIQKGLPPLSDVTRKVKSQADFLESQLNASAMNYLTVLFLIRAIPVLNPTATETHAYFTIVENGEAKVHEAHDRTDIRHDIKRLFPSIIERIKSGSILPSRKKYKVPPDTQGKISNTKAASILGIHRYQITRIQKYIFNKIGRDKIIKIAEMLQLLPSEMPTAWKKLLRKTQTREMDNRPVCPGCGERVSATATECPNKNCRRML